MSAREKLQERTRPRIPVVIYVPDISACFGEVSCLYRPINLTCPQIRFPSREKERERGNARRERGDNAKAAIGVYICEQTPSKCREWSGFSSARDQIFLYINVASFQCRTCPAYLGRWCYLYTVSSLCIRLVCPVQWAAWQLISDQETNTSLPLCCRPVPPFDSPLRYFDCSPPTYVPLLSRYFTLTWLLTVPSS